MSQVPHDLTVSVQAPLALENKVRRMIKGCNMEPTAAAIDRMTKMLRDAFEGLNGRSNLTDWRIVTEWNDSIAYAALDAFIRRSLKFRERINGEVTPKGQVHRFY